MLFDCQSFHGGDWFPEVSHCQTTPAPQLQLFHIRNFSSLSSHCQGYCWDCSPTLPAQENGVRVWNSPTAPVGEFAAPQPRAQLGNSVQYLGKETSDCTYYLVHSFTREHPQSQQTSQRERMEYFTCFLPQAAAGKQLIFTWWVDNMHSREDFSADRTKQTFTPFSPKGILYWQVSSIFILKRNSSIPKLLQSPFHWLCSSQGGQFQSNEECPWTTLYTPPIA